MPQKPVTAKLRGSWKGTASVPLSDNSQIALLADGRVACVIESYEDRVHCVDREGVVVGSFGRKGEGPGGAGGEATVVRAPT